MKLLLLIVIFILTSFLVYSQPWTKEIIDKKDNFFDVQQSFNDYWQGKEIKRGNGWKQFKRWEYFWEQRTFPDGKIENGLTIYNEYLKFVRQNKDDNIFQALTSSWEELGPVNVPANKLMYKSGGLGRINVVRVNPYNDNNIWVGSAGGGAWYSTNRGQNWQTVNFTGILSMGVSDIAIAYSNPNIIYIATGDKNGFFMSNEYSAGILKSTDGGKNFALTSFSFDVDESALTNRIIINPNDHNLIFAATSKGILRSKDGAKTWENVYSALAFRDIEFKTDNPNVIFAASSGLSSSSSNSKIFRSIDGGNTWNLISTLSGSCRVDLAVTPANANYIYAVAAKTYSGAFSGLYKSVDGGATFTLQSASPNILGIEFDGSGNEGQGFYDLAIAVSSLNPDLVFVGGIHAWKSTDGGKKWNILNHWTGSYGLPFVHADQHHFYFNPVTFELYAANDGGLFVTSNNGSSWKDLSNGLAILQLYKINVSENEKDLVITGSQDNGTNFFNGQSWQHVNGGDGMTCAIDPKDKNYVYATTQNGNIFLSKSGGSNFSRIAGPDLFQGEYSNWVIPFVLNPVNPKSIYAGYRNIYKSTNRGSSWFKLTNFSNSGAINNLAVSEKDTNYVYFSIRNFLYKSINGGQTFEVLFNKTSHITGIAVDPDNPSRVFVSLSGYRADEKVFEINGSAIKNLSFNLPNIPVNTIVIQKNTSGRLFIGTDIGVYAKMDDFINEWTLESNQLPPVVISDLRINYSNGKLYAGTYGRGVWSTELFKCSAEKPNVKIDGNVEFCLGDSVLLTAETPFKNFLWSNGDTSKTITVKTSGVYYVSIKDSLGCTEKSDPVNINQLFIPSFSISSAKGLVICGESDTLSLKVRSGLENYLWSTGDTTDGISVFEPGIYTVSAKTTNGCNVFDSVYIPMRQKPGKPNIYLNENTLSTDSAYSYKWFKDGSGLTLSTSKDFSPSESGNYYVIVFNEHGCGSSSELKEVTITSVYENIIKNEFKISPNPFTNIIRISSFNEHQNVEILISDNLGRIVLKDFISSFNNGQELILNAESLPMGSYIILIKSANNLYSFNLRKFE